MAKKQTRRSISVSRTTYERLKAFCDTNHISMSQLVETRVNDFLGASDFTPSATGPAVASAAPRSAPIPTSPRLPTVSPARPAEPRGAHVAGAGSTGAVASTAGFPPPSPASHPAGHPAPMTSAAARFAIEPPPPIIKPRQETAAPKPAEKRPEQIFTF